jgi:hypothetical protein
MAELEKMKTLPKCRDCKYNENYKKISDDGYFKTIYTSFCCIERGAVIKVPWDRPVCKDFCAREVSYNLLTD